MKAEATPARDGGGFSFAVPAERDLEFFGDDGQATLFRDSILGLERLGGRPVTVDFAPFRAVAGLLYEGPFVAERLAALGSFLQEHPEALHPVTRGILEGGSKYTAVDVFRAYHKLEQLRPVCLDFFRHAEVLVVPTMPTVPKTADVHADSLGWSRRLGHYTNFVNLLGLAAIAVPAGFTPAGLPGGITLIGPAGSDDRLCELGIAWQRHLDIPFGAIGWRLAAAPVHTAPSEGWVRVAVAGAHLKGQPLHAALLQTGARFVRTCRTASRYRFVALLDLDPPRPGLLRDDHRAGSTEVEIYDLPLAGFGVLVASVAPPLAIGTVELADGEAVKGFLCESHAAARARDITEFGGWVAFRKSLHSAGTVS